MDATTKNYGVTSIIECFEELKDPRVLGRTKHKLINIIVISICAIICGANKWKEIESFAYAKEGGLQMLRMYAGWNERFLKQVIGL